MGQVDIVVIDRDRARRAHIAAMGECIGASVVVYSSRRACEIDRPDAALYLVERKAAPARAGRYTGGHIVAFGAGPAGGASNYLVWPFGPAAIRSRLAAALADAADRGETPAHGRLATWSVRLAVAMPWLRQR